MLTMTDSMSLTGFHPSAVRSSMQRAPFMTNPVWRLKRGRTTRTNGGAKGYWSGNLISSSMCSSPRTSMSWWRLESVSKPKSRMVQASMESSDLGSMSYPASPVSFIMILYRSDARRRFPPVVSFSARRDMLTASRDGSRHFLDRDGRGGASDTGARSEPLPPLAAAAAPEAAAAPPLLLLLLPAASSAPPTPTPPPPPPAAAAAAAWSPSALAGAETAWGTADGGWAASTRNPP
mmetsp:Transcript_15200/g.43949  ORF Transcript_15200/g.43949 Transcript_15200/m.43949 type:complete len:235 (-) Transcript_15200:605-1309(-)